MSAAVQIKLSESAQRSLERLEGLKRTAMRAIADALDLENQYTVGHIQAKRMTGAGPFPVVQGRLGVRTNRLRGSLRASKAIIRGSMIHSAIGTNVRYAAIHEFGGKTAPHVIRPIKKKALHFMMGGHSVFAASVNHPGSNIPARKPIYRGILDRQKNYRTAISDAITRTLGQA